ncbi:MAG: starch-binding protein [Ruminococcus sp.]|jgi:alpha-amylase|uniref:starch-binding protein n=1 Tax=uncultured Ruminococcus sp. TaxID=165186 RepID=UPI0025DD8E56|nr:starch-binding protein [uncultured Ruminococcus sp.]MCI2113192.1 starch-binding protein [Ruminococcus sp.]
MKKKSNRIISVILAAMLVVTSIVTSGLITTSAATGDTVYCETDGFEPYCYMWIDGKTNNGSWPGVKMTKVKDNIYSYTLDNDYVNIIFNNGGDSKKTSDMIYPGDNQIYNFSTGKWSVYDVSASKPIISVDKKDKTSFKTDTLDVAITVTNADSAQYKVDNGEWVAFSDSATATVGKDTAIDAYTTLTVSATNANGTETATYQYLKKDPNAPVGTDGSTTPALTGKYATNPNNQYGVRKTISVDGDKSDWDCSMLIAQGTANDDPRVYRPGSMYEIAMDDYALYAAWDNDNLYLMWEMANVQDIVAPNDDFPLSQGNLWIYNMPIFFAINTGLGNVSDGTTAGGGTLWDSGITYTTDFDTIITCSTNNSNGPFIYPADDNGKVGVEKYAGTSTGINMKWGNGKTLSGKLIGINGGYGKYHDRAPGDTLLDSSDWVDFYELGHDSKLDMFYEMSVPLEKLGISASDIETNGIGIMKISTFGTSGMDSLPYDPSMSDNADKAYSKQEPNSQEKEDEDNITVPLARIGKALSGGNTDPTTPTATTPVPTEPTTEPTTAPVPTTEPTTATVPTTEPTTAPDKVILGDANGDNLITIADATLIQKVAAGLDTLTEKYVKAADVDGNGTINIKDATYIQKYNAEIEIEYNVGSEI